MVFNPQTGIFGSVTNQNGTVYAFGKWSFHTQTVSHKVNNFTGAGYQQVVPGVTSGELTLEALTYDQGNMPFGTGWNNALQNNALLPNTYYTFNLYYNATTFVTVTVLIKDLETVVDYDGLESVKITCDTHGSFLPYIL